MLVPSKKYKAKYSIYHHECEKRGLTYSFSLIDGFDRKDEVAKIIANEWGVPKESVIIHEVLEDET